MRQIVLDTNVLVAALRSSRGASHQLLRLVGSRTAGFRINLSVPLVLEYEMAPSRDPEIETGIVEPVLDYLCKTGRVLAAAAERKSLDMSTPMSGDEPVDLPNRSRRKSSA
jgi:hypothetical protein